MPIVKTGTQKMKGMQKNNKSNIFYLIEKKDTFLILVLSIKQIFEYKKVPSSFNQ
jgi:hypothetical protein